MEELGSGTNVSLPRDITLWQDDEVAAIHRCHMVLRELSPEQQARILRYFISRYELPGVPF